MVMNTDFKILSSGINIVEKHAYYLRKVLNTQGIIEPTE